jgi:hypothetical protein
MISRVPPSNPTRGTTALACILVIAALSACQSPESETLGATRRSITDGVEHDGHVFVGGLTSGGGICTATLVGKRTLVTAAHCVRDNGRFFFLAEGVWYRSRKAKRHPDYQPGVVAGTDDVAVVLLERAPPIPHVPISRGVPAVGSQVTLVGFGLTATGRRDSGTKRIAVNTVSSINSRTLLFSGTGNGIGNICSGDSGGPAFADFGQGEVQVGVHSWGQDPCGSLSGSMRLDIYVDWLLSESDGDIAVDQTPSALLDRNPPTVRVDAPLPTKDGAAGELGDARDSAIEVGTRPTLELTASDDSGVQRLEVYVDGLLEHEQRYEGLQPTVTLKLPLGLAPGERRVEIHAFDQLGKRGSTGVTLRASLAQQGTPGEPAGCHFDADDRWVCPDDSGSSGGCHLARPDRGAPVGLPLTLALLALLLIARLALRRRLGQRSARDLP